MDANLSNSPIFLIGYRACGKTTIGPILAERLGFDSIDADHEIERRAGKSIAHIFADEGEASFRDQESRVIGDLCQRTGAVVSLGGGAVMRDANRIAIQSAGPVVWLKASIDVIFDRLAADPTTRHRRPNLTKSGGRTEIETLLAERAPNYRACATFEVDTDSKTPDAITEEILRHLALDS